MRYLPILILFAFVMFTGCETTTGPAGDGTVSLSSLVGTWNATQFVVTNKADTSQSVDLIQAGASVTFSVDTGGNYTVAFVQGQSTDVETGSLTVSGNLVILAPSGGGSVDTTTFSLSGDILVVLIENFEYDFNGDNVDDPARARIVFQKSTTSDGGGTVPAEVVGTWNATEFVFINNADTTQKFDLIQNGATFVLQIDSDGNYSATTTFDTNVETTTGTLAFSGDQVTITETGQTESDTITYSVSGNTMVLVTTDEEFDFDEDGTDESATMRITLQKG